jgi:metal-sulfur cluster biosynthetic enzyme
MITAETIWTHLQNLQDPMFGEPLSVVDVGLVYEVRVTGSAVYVTILMFNRGRVLIDAAGSPVRQHLLQLEGVTEAAVEVLWQPPWTPDRLSPRARQVLGFTDDDPPEGRMHVRAEVRAKGDEEPFDARHLDAPRLHMGTHSLILKDLPRDKFRQWWGGWRYYRRFAVAESSGQPRRREPVHVDVEFTAGQVDDCAREIRIVDEASAQEIPCQVYREGSDGDGRSCSVLFMAETEAHEQKTYLLLHGNPSPACWAPLYPTDLVTRGEGFALEIDNGVYRARLSPVMGHLRNLEFRRWGHTKLGWDDPSPISLIDAENDPLSKLDIAWHGEDDCIHWNPDFRNQLRYRMTNWPQAPNYEVTRGALCTIVKRWGYPVCPTHPARDQTAVRLEVTYEFYDGLPYFMMTSALIVEAEADILVVRNDEWLFRQAFSHSLRMDEGGQILTAPAAQEITFDRNPALVGFFDDTNHDAFVSLRLAYDAGGFPGAYDPSMLTLGTTGYGNQVWSRDLFHESREMAIQPGSTATETNAYLCFSTAEGGLEQAAEWYNQLRDPLSVTLSSG